MYIEANVVTYDAVKLVIVMYILYIDISGGLGFGACLVSSANMCATH